MSAPTGEQYVITRGTSRAVIAQLAASLRECSINGVEVTESYPETGTPPFGDGIVLMPWPNRIEDGIWTLDGKQLQLDLTEPTRHNAIHGLLRNTAYTMVEHTESAVTLRATVFPQHGYPFLLDTTVRYELVDDGLAVTHTVTNLSEAKAPVAVGTHPFLKIGDVPSEDLVVIVHASTYFDVDERLNPIAEVPVEGTVFDLREGGRIGDLELDTAFGGVRTVDGVSAILRAPDGREVRLVQDEFHPYVQVFITPIFPKGLDRPVTDEHDKPIVDDGDYAELADGLGTAVAIEPMTAPPNAFNTGVGVRWVEPGEQWSLGWGIQYAE